MKWELMPFLPAANHLFFVNTKDPILLGENKAQLFHQILAKMLFLSKRSLPDLSTAVAFGTTRVMLEDWRKNVVWRKDPKDTKNAKDTKVPELYKMNYLLKTERVHKGNL